DAAACALDQAAAPRCRFYREVLVRDDAAAHEAFFDLCWRLEPDGRVALSALTSVPEGTPVTFTVHRHPGPVPWPAPTSATHAERPSFGPVLGKVAGRVQGGVAMARWTPPEGLDPFDWLQWLVDDQANPGAPPVQP